MVTACSPSEPSAQALPTIFPSPLPGEYSLEGAQRVAELYLSAWQKQDLQGMYALISSANQEATPFETFQTLYETSQNEMSFKSLTYTANTLVRDQARLVTYNYNVTFTTSILGVFTDQNRDLHLIVDDKSNEWRVAWSPGDIFAEMRNGGRLRLERIIPSRANIYDRTGEVILADQLGRVVVVSVIKQNIPQYDACVNELVQVLNKPIDAVQKTLNDASPDWLTEVGVIESGVYLATHQQLETLCDAQFQDRATRRYPNGMLAPHIIGSVGYMDASEIPAMEDIGFTQESILGQSGVEASWDETLRGRPGGRLTVVTPGGDVLREVARSAPQPGQSVWLTIDTDLQQFTLQAISETYVKNAGSKYDWTKGSKGAAAVVMDVNTGEILAMVSYPSYDGNAFVPFPAIGQDAAKTIQQQVADDPRLPLLNRVTQGQYPAGSVMKTVDTIGVANSGVYELDHAYTCLGSGSWNRDIPRADWLPGGHGRITLPQALTRSCDPYFYETGYQMNLRDPFLLPNYARMFGLGAPTGIHDVAEAPGLIPDPDWLRTTYGATWTFSDAVNMAIGQGYVEVTPLQLVRMMATVANGGHLLRPQLVKQAGIIGEDPSYVAKPEVQSDLHIRADVLQMAQGALCAVTTDRSGTAEFVFRDSPLQDLDVCGKTGTAEAPGADSNPHAWFVAYAPRDNPKIAIAVMVENSGEGSEIAAPIVRQILEYYFFGIK